MLNNHPDYVHGADMGPTWVLSAPDGPHVGPMNLAIRAPANHLQYSEDMATVQWIVFLLSTIPETATNQTYHHNDAIMSAMRLKSPASRLFAQLFIRAQIKEDIKSLCHWPLCGEFTDDRKKFPFNDVIMDATNIYTHILHLADYNDSKEPVWLCREHAMIIFPNMWISITSMLVHRFKVLLSWWIG